jgi:hypothetical protein
LTNLPEAALRDVQQLCVFAGKLDSPIAAHLEQMLERLDERIAKL